MKNSVLRDGKPVTDWMHMLLTTQFTSIAIAPTLPIRARMSLLASLALLLVGGLQSSSLIAKQRIAFDPNNVHVPEPASALSVANWRSVRWQDAPIFPTTWITQQAYLKANVADMDDRFGHSIAISGDTVVIGAPSEDSNGNGPGDNSRPNSGAVYVFTRSGDHWTQQAFLKGGNSKSGDRFGHSVAISGDTIVVGAPYHNDVAANAAGGAAYVFTRAGTHWQQQAYLSRQTTLGSFSIFGDSVAICGDTILVGASAEHRDGAGTTGAAYVFVRQGHEWEQQARLLANNGGELDRLGYSVALSGDVAVIGAHGEDGSAWGSASDNSVPDSGAAYVFVRNGDVWIEQTRLKAINADSGDNFGSSVAIFNDTLVIGAPYEDSNGSHGGNNDASDAGAAYVYTRESNGTWYWTDFLKAESAASDDLFGHSVAIWGNRIVVGAPGEDGNGSNPGNNAATDAGAVYAFWRRDGSWSDQTYLKAINAGPGDRFGDSVAIADHDISISAPLEASD